MGVLLIIHAFSHQKPPRYELPANSTQLFTSNAIFSSGLVTQSWIFALDQIYAWVIYWLSKVLCFPYQPFGQWDSETVFVKGFPVKLSFGEQGGPKERAPG